MLLQPLYIHVCIMAIIYYYGHYVTYYCPEKGSLCMWLLYIPFSDKPHINEIGHLIGYKLVLVTQASCYTETTFIVVVYCIQRLI